MDYPINRLMLRVGMALHLQIVKRSHGVRGFAVLPKRWIVERTLA